MVIDLKKGEEILGFSKIEICRHAQDRMKQRNVSLAEIMKAIKMPDRTGLPTQPNRMRVRWNRTTLWAVDIVYDTIPDRVRVITVIVVKRPLVDRKKT